MMRRVVALLFLIWGVATVLVGGANVYMGNMPAEKLIAVFVGGGLLLGIAWWLDRPSRRKPRSPDAKGQELG